MLKWFNLRRKRLCLWLPPVNLLLAQASQQPLKRRSSSSKRLSKSWFNLRRRRVCLWPPPVNLLLAQASQQPLKRRSSSSKRLNRNLSNFTERSHRFSAKVPRRPTRKSRLSSPSARRISKSLSRRQFSPPSRLRRKKSSPCTLPSNQSNPPSPVNDLDW